MLVRIKRQDDLAICNLDDGGKWFWTCCYKGASKMLGHRLAPDEEILVNLEVTEMKPFKSNKTQIGVMSAWGITIFAVLAVKYLGFTPAEVGVVLPCVTAIIVAHILGYALTDALVHFGKGQSR